MSGQVEAVNRELKALDEAHRLGRISRTEYRSRRRRLIGTLYDGSGVVTARKALRHPASGPVSTAVFGNDAHKGSEHALRSLVSMRPAIAWGAWLMFATVLLVLILMGWWLLRH